MSNKGYQLESEIEDFFLSFTGQTKKDPILKTTETGIIQINRSFRVPSSGAKDSLAGDVITYLPWLPCQLKIEAKSRYDKTKGEGSIISIEHEWIKKNNEEAKADNQMPLLAFTFKKVKQDRLWWILKDEDLNKLLHSVSFDQHTRAWRRDETKRVNHTNKKGDRTKLVHKELLALDEDIPVFSIDVEKYALLRHTAFETLMKTFKSNDQKFKKQAEQMTKRRRARYVQNI